MIKIYSSSVLLPDYVADSVLDIDPGTLKQTGVTHIVFDLDKTLVRYRSNKISPDYLQLVVSLQEAGFVVLIGSNTRRDITSLTSLLGAQAIVPKGLSYKPHRSFYKRLVDAAGTSPDCMVMIGDHILNDAIGANLAGFNTILVRGLRSKTSLVYRAYIKRVLTHAVM